MNMHSKKYSWGGALLVVLLMMVLSACGAGASNSASEQMSPAQSTSGGKNSALAQKYSSQKSATDSRGAQTKQDIKTTVPQYLIKTLKVSMYLTDTKQGADDLQQWINGHDPLSTSAGTDYQQVSNNSFNISLTFSVQADKYLDVYRYLRDYAPAHNGRLYGFNESVQDVTNDYVDTEARLKNLRNELGRLQTLMSNAKTLSEILSIEEKITTVTEEIEKSQARKNLLASQTSFYTVSIMLYPLAVSKPIDPTPKGWSIGQTFQDAFTASMELGQSLISFIIWLLAYSIYIVPMALIVWLLYRRYNRSYRSVRPKMGVGGPPSE